MVKGISKNDFRDLLIMATKDSIAIFNKKFYIRVDGDAMGSPLGPLLGKLSFNMTKKTGWINTL